MTHAANSTQPEEIKIPVPWGHISGKWWGSRSRQPVLAVHGWQDNAGTFDRLIPLLPAEVSVLCIDLPGHGLSSHYPAGEFYYIFWDGLVAVRRVVKHFKWSNITILGHSLGGAVGFLYAGTFPDDIDKLISIDIISPSVKDVSTIVKETGSVIDRFLKYETLSSDSIPCYSYDEMIDLVCDAYNGSLTRSSCEILMKRGMSPVSPSSRNAGNYCFSRDVRLKVAGLGTVSVDVVMEYASKITCKVLNIKAVPGMSFGIPENYELVLKKIKESAKLLEYYEVEGSHHVHLNNPERISMYISKFLTSDNCASIVKNGN